MKQRMYRTLSGVERHTYLCDSIRSIPDGFVVSFAQTFFLLIAISVFHTSDFAKSIISSSNFIGFLLALFTSVLFKGRKISTAAAALTFLGGVAIILTGCAVSSWLYVAGVVASGIAINMRPPLFTSLYEQNYKKTHLGRLYSTAILLSTFSTLFASTAIGFLLDRDIHLYRIPFIVVGCALVAVSWLVHTIPSGKLGMKRVTGFLSDLSLLWKNRLFGIMSLSWFLMGFANLWSLPLRVVYLAEADRGLGLSPLYVSIVLGIVPPAIRLLTNRMWAVLFDKIELLHYRILVNVFIGTGILLFFATKNLVVINIGNVLLNVGFAGSPFIWNLWVNKIAPAGESHRYMSVHTFLAGIRGIAAPFAGFSFIGVFSISMVGYASVGLVLVSILLLVPLISSLHSLRPSD